MEDEMIFDIKIYEWDKYGRNYTNRPRRIDDGEYHIEWHRQGIEFKRCPDGIIHHTSDRIQDVHVMSGQLVSWGELTEPAGSNGLLLFEFYPDANTPRYKILVIKRAPSEWIEWNTRVPDNINTEVMWQLAQIEEWKWKPQMPLNEIRNILIELQNSLPEGIDDSVRDLILNTWKQRWMERAAQSMLSSETGNQITAAVNSFKIIMNDL